MRFGFIELVGYAGIYDGMGLNQIRIDYTKCIYGNIVITSFWGNYSRAGFKRGTLYDKKKNY